MILGYPPIAIPESLKEQKMAIISVRQEYKSIEGCQNYQTVIGTIYGEQDLPMEIRKSNRNFKYRKLKCFNCEIHEHIARDCKKLKKEKDIQKYYEYRRKEYIVKDCKIKQKMKK